MFVEFREAVYMVRFDHTPYKKQAKGEKAERRSTRCQIYQLMPENVTEFDRTIKYNTRIWPAIQIAEGTSTCSTTDVAMFNRAYGRMISLQRALRSAIENGAFRDGDAAYKTFMNDLKSNHPRGMESAVKLSKDRTYTDPKAIKH